MYKFNGQLTCDSCEEYVFIEGYRYEDDDCFFGTCPKCGAEVEGDLPEQIDPDRYNDYNDIN